MKKAPPMVQAIADTQVGHMMQTSSARPGYPDTPPVPASAHPLIGVTVDLLKVGHQPVLDKGYLKYIEHWGSDERVVEAARMSTDGAFRGWGTEGNPGDEKLLAYLMNHNHATPFEMAGLVIEVEAPIVVFREWHRHRTQSYNELSARYTPLPDSNYLPTVERCLIINAQNKQAGKIKGAQELTHEKALYWLGVLDQHYRNAEMVYQDGLAIGIPKELARLCIPVGRYSRMRASANLRNWLAFMTLRDAPDAQWEIREYAKACGRVIAACFPRTWALFEEKRGEPERMRTAHAMLVEGAKHAGRELMAFELSVRNVEAVLDRRVTEAPAEGTLARRVWDDHIGYREIDEHVLLIAEQR